MPAPTLLSDVALQLSERDEVAIALQPISAGTTLRLGADGRELTVGQDVPRSHKLALTDLAVGAQLHKYGQSIGRLTTAVQAGDHVHSHNLGMDDTGREHEFGTPRRSLSRRKGRCRPSRAIAGRTDAPAPGATSAS